MSESLATYSRAQLQAMTLIVAEELGCGPEESLAQAAFRVLRLNIAGRRAQRVARVIAGCGQGPSHQQWEAIERCCVMILGPRRPRALKPVKR